MCLWTYCVSSADGVGNVAAKSSQPGAFNRFLSDQLEAEQQVLLFSRRTDHQSKRVDALCKTGQKSDDFKAPSFALGGQWRAFRRRHTTASSSARVNVLTPSPSVSCRSKTRRICDSGISAMCLSGGGGLVCPTGLLNVLITLWRLRAICKDTKSKRRQLQILLIDLG